MPTSGAVAAIRAGRSCFGAGSPCAACVVGFGISVTLPVGAGATRSCLAGTFAPGIRRRCLGRCDCSRTGPPETARPTGSGDWSCWRPASGGGIRCSGTSGIKFTKTPNSPATPWVVKSLPDGRRAYAEALLSVCESMSPTAVPAPALGVGGARRNLERRLRMILKERVPAQISRSVVLAVLLLGVLTLPAWTQLRTDAVQPPAAATDLTTDQPAPKPTDPVVPQPRKNTRFDSNVVNNTHPGHNNDHTAHSHAKSKVRQLESTILKLKHEISRLQRRKPSRARSPFGMVSQPAASNTTSPFGRVRGAAAPNEVVDSHTIILQRTTYRLPKARAKALEAFLKHHVKAKVLQFSIGTTQKAVRTTKSRLREPRRAGVENRTRNPHPHVRDPDDHDDPRRPEDDRTTDRDHAKRRPQGSARRAGTRS